MRKRPMCLACLGFMLVLVLLRIAGVPLGTPFSDPKYENKAQQGRKVWIAGTIETYEKKSSNNGYVLRGEGSKGKIYLLAKRGDLPVGAAVRVYGTVKKPESPRNPGMFDEKTYYEGKGCAFYVISEREEVVDVGRWNLGEALRLERERCCAVLKEMMPEEEAGVLSAMLLGERSELTEETYLAYQQSGLLHLISVSGMHLMLLGMALRRLLMALHLPKTPASLAAAAGMVLYGMFTGSGTATVRAVVMFAVRMGAVAVGRTYDSLSALSLAAILMLAENPSYLEQSGFWLSFGAVTAISGVYPVLAGEKAERKRRGEKTGLEKLAAKGKEAAMVYLSLQLVMIPLQAWYFYEIPVYAVFVNLLMLPMMGVLLGFGAAGGMVGLLSLPLAKGMLFPCRILLFMGKHICALAGMLPGAMWIVGRPQRWQIAVYYAFLGVGTCLLHRQREQREREKEHGRRAEQKNGGHPGVFLAGLLLLAVLGVPRSGEAELDMLDVGQGDGCYLQTKEGYHLFVDGGSSNVGKVGIYRILPFLKYKGVKKIDCWVVSHTDEDHISGLREILSSGYPVEYLAVAEQMPRDENWEELEALAEDAGTKVVWLRRGDIWHFGKATFTALHPGETEAAFGGQSVDKNEESLVLFYQEDDFTGVFTGDIGAAQEEEILTWLQKTKTGADVQKIDFYKAAHHGSRYSNSTGFLESLAPEIALVSCSRTNRYGHPSKEAVGHMQQAGSQVYYTMESGRLCVKKTDGQAVCRGYLEEKEQWWQ